MDCHGDTAAVNLCSKPECVNSAVAFKDADGRMHLPSHRMLKVHWNLFKFNGDTEWVENAAKGALESARDTLSGLKEERKPMPACVDCKVKISLPCWFCVECTGE